MQGEPLHFRGAASEIFGQRRTGRRRVRVNFEHGIEAFAVSSSGLHP